MIKINDIWKNRILTVLKITVTILFFFIIFYKVNFFSILEKLKNISWYYFLIAILLIILMQVQQVLRWQVLLKVKIPTLPSFMKLFKYHLFGLFFQLFLPSTISGDLLRAWRLARTLPNKTDSYSSALFSRLVGLLIFFILGLLLFIVFPSTFMILPAIQRMSVIAVYLLLFIALYLIFSPSVTRYLAGIFNIKLWQKGLHKIADFQTSINEYRRSPRVIMITFFITLGIYFCMIINTWIVFLAFGRHLPFYAIFAYTPIIYIIQLLPISLNGSGIREISMYFFFKTYGITIDDIALYAIIGYGSVIAVNMVGGLTMIYDSIMHRN